MADFGEERIKKKDKFVIVEGYFYHFPIKICGGDVIGRVVENFYTFFYIFKYSYTFFGK